MHTCVPQNIIKRNVLSKNFEKIQVKGDLKITIYDYGPKLAFYSQMVIWNLILNS